MSGIMPHTVSTPARLNVPVILRSLLLQCDTFDTNVVRCIMLGADECSINPDGFRIMFERQQGKRKQVSQIA